MIFPFRAVGFLSKKFLSSKQDFVSLIAGISVVGVALGVMALVVVTSVINGFETELTRGITALNGDVVLYSRGDPVENPEKVEEKLRTQIPEVRAVTQSFIFELMIAGPAGSAGAVLEGVDLRTVGDVTSFQKRIFEGRAPHMPNEVVLGDALAQKIGAKVGSKVRWVAPFGVDTKESPDGEVQSKVQEVEVVGLVRLGLYEYDSKTCFGLIHAVQEFVGKPHQVTSFKLKLTEGTDARAVSDRLGEVFGFPFRAKDWSQWNRNIFYAIKLEKAVIGIILTVIVIVAAFNVVSTLMMMIHDKAREISILKAMGLANRAAYALFTWVGLGIGIVGTTLGVVLGLGLNEVIARTTLVRLPADVYYIGFLPVVVRWNEVMGIVWVALIIMFVATIYPSIQVARRSPIDGMRWGE